MSNKEIGRLTDLVKEQLKKGISKEEALEAFMRAGIRTANGGFTKPYKNLGKAIKPR